jgi:hypothetical protein
VATGVTYTDSSTLTSGQQTLIAGAGMAFEAAAPDPDLVRVEQLPEGHRQANLGIFARLAQASALQESVDLQSSEQLSTNYITIEPSEHGIQVTISKREMRRQMDAQVRSVAGEQMGGSLRRREANDVITLYDTFTTTAPGAGSVLDIGHFRGAVAYLLTDNSSAYGPAPMPVHAALHIEQISDIILDITDPGTGAGQSRPTGPFNELIKGWWRGNDRLYGVAIWHSGNIARDSAFDSKGTIKHQNSLVLVEEGGAEAVDETDESARITEFGLFKSWGEALQIDVHGVEVHSDTVASFA